MPFTPPGKLDHFAGLDVLQAVDAGDAVADRQDAADFGDLGFGAEALDLLFQDGGNFSGADVHVRVTSSSIFKRISARVAARPAWI